MSEPPRKKKKTILDFFKKSKSEQDKADKSGSKSKMSNEISSNSVQLPPNNSAKTIHPTVNADDKNFKDESVNKSGSSASNAIPIDNDEAISQTLQMEEYSGSDFGSQQESTGEMSQDLLQDIPLRKPSQRGSDCVWRGIPMKQLNKSPECLDKLPSLHSTDHHTVLFKCQNYKYDAKKPPDPFPASFKDKWDSNFVRMPCSNFNEYPVKGKDNKQIVRARWELIQEQLLRKIPGPYELENAILQYNTRYAERWDFQNMHQFFTIELSLEERNQFFNKVLPNMVQLALQLPNLCTQPIPMLKKGKSHSVTFSQQQIACLLANAFFCTFPRRNAKQKTSEYSNYPTINLNSLFDGRPVKIKAEKLKCLMHYFRRVTDDMPMGNVTFTRQCIDKNKFPQWIEMNTHLRGLHVSAEGTIEDDGIGLLQVDFANKFLGGGVLGFGCVQEEIRFLICPEMFVSRLITECLEPNECLIMKGCEQFSLYDGYASTFKWNGDFRDKTERDSWGRLCTDVVAIDALVIRQFGNQFKKDLVFRELNKAYCGFLSVPHVPDQHLTAVCTGNWGCGAFGGDKQLKALLQIMAASAAHRDTCYFTFDDKQLRDDLYKIHHYLTVTNSLPIGDILTLIFRYEREYIKYERKKPKLKLYQYITKVFDGTLETTDSETEMDFSESSQEAHVHHKESHHHGNLDKQDSLDYKANTP